MNGSSKQILKANNSIQSIINRQKWIAKQIEQYQKKLKQQEGEILSYMGENQILFDRRGEKVIAHWERDKNGNIRLINMNLEPDVDTHEDV